jgi:hypothetical protein
MHALAAGTASGLRGREPDSPKRGKTAAGVFTAPEAVDPI